MTDSEHCPSRADWEQWINGEGDVAINEDELCGHLDCCDSCQHSVAELSDGDPFYRESRRALRSSGLSHHDWDSKPTSAIVADVAPQRDSAIVSLVRSLLGPTDDDRSIGRLGRFEVLGIVCSGGMGIVLKARSIEMDRIVAIKIPQPHYWQSTNMLATLEREARSAAAVVHPNVISIYHVDRYREVPYLVMPYLPGQTLERRIRDSGACSLEESLRVVRQVARALAAAHTCGVVHRDVKPANILLGNGTDRVVLSDFGLAKVQSDATCTATGTFAGTPIYLSPEQASGVGAGPPGDVFSLGTVLWTMLVGSPPYDGMHTHAIVRKIADSPSPRLSDHRPGLPTWTYRLVDRMHHPVPAERPTAAQLCDWVETCQRHLADPRSVPLPMKLCDHRSLQPRRGLAIGIVGLSLVAVLVLLVAKPFLGENSDAPHRPGESTRRQSDTQSQSLPPTTASARQRSSTAQSNAAQSNAAPASPTPNATSAASEMSYLNSLRSEIEELNQSVIPNWERKIEQLSDPVLGNSDANSSPPLPTTE